MNRYHLVLDNERTDILFQPQYMQDGIHLASDGFETRALIVRFGNVVGEVIDRLDYIYPSNTLDGVTGETPFFDLNRRLAESVGWYVTGFKDAIYDREREEWVDTGNLFYLLRDPAGVPFENGQPAASSVGPYITTVKKRITEAEAWLHLPKDPVEIVARKRGK